MNRQQIHDILAFIVGACCAAILVYSFVVGWGTT